MKRVRIDVGVLGAMLALAGCSREAPPAQSGEVSPPRTSSPAQEVVLDEQGQRQAGVKVQAVEVRSAPHVLRATGRIALNENATWRVGAVTNGRIVRVLANVGDRVRQGQVLARMHSHDIHEARAEYRKAIAELARLRTAESYSLRARDRARRLLELKAGSVEAAEQAEAVLRNSQTAAANAEVEVDRTRRHLTEFLRIPADVPDHDPQQPHTDDSNLIPIESPASGVVMTRNVTPGTVVEPSTELFRGSDLSVLWMIAAVSEEYLSRLRPGMPVRVFVQAYPDRPFRGRIGKLGDELDATTRTINVRVELPNRGGLLKPEMYAAAEIEAGGSERALFVPQEAVQEVGGQTVVFVRSGGARFEARPVQTGRVIDGAQEIAGGLKSGEAVVMSGSFILKSLLLKSSLAEEE